MIIYNSLRINRMVMHRIVARTADVDHATVDYNDTLIPIDGEIEEVLKDRLSSSFGGIQSRLNCLLKMMMPIQLLAL